MIINKFVFPIKADKTFVSGALPQGYLTANDINKDMFYVLSPSVGATIIKAKFQNNKQNELPIIVDMLATDIDIKMLVDENASYYDLVKDWNVWQGYFPSKALEYVSYNRAGKIGISFTLKQSILPPLPQLEFKGKLVSEDDKVLENGYYIVDTPLYEVDGNSLTFNDIIIKNDNDIIIRKSIVQSGNTGTVEYGVDPSVYGGVDESIDITLTESIIDKVNDNTNEIKYIKLKLDNYYEKNETYNRDEVDNLFEDVNLEIVDLKEDILGLETDNTLIKDRLDDVENLASNNSGRLDDVESDIIRIDIKDTEQDTKINELENANMLKDVVYNNVNGVLTFTRYDDTTKEIDLPLELLVESGYYDEVANELVLVLANGSDIRIPVGNLLTDLDAHNIRFNGSGTNYLINKQDVEGAVKELDTQVALKVSKSDIVNDLVSTDTNKPLSANQGKVLNDTTAKLAVSNVFTQPQQVPNATLPQHTTNLSQVETMFEMFKQQFRGYNLAMPDLTTATDLGDGLYRLRNVSDLTIDYNIYNGHYILNGISSNVALILINSLPIDDGEIISLSSYYISGSFDVLPNLRMSDAGANDIPIGNNRLNFQYATPPLENSSIAIRLGIGNVFNNYQFKFQIEQGTEATPYTVPGEIPQYKIVGEE